jgi:hypothetical protein
MEKEITRNQAGRIIRMIRKGCMEFTFTILLQTTQHRSHYHHRKLRIFGANSPGLNDKQTNKAA